MIAASELERHMLTLINAERQALGIDPLALETNLNQSAEDHSKWMLEADRFSHRGEGGSSPTDRIVEADFDLSGSWRTAENIAIRSEQGEDGYFDEVEALHEGLMDSPGHRANLLNPDLKYIGIGIEVGDYNFGGGETEAVVVTQNFANTQGTVDLDTAGLPEPDIGEEPDDQTPDEEMPEEEPPTDEAPDEEKPEDQTPEEETPDESEPEDEPPVEDPMPNPDPEMADCDLPDDVLPEDLRMDIAQWLIEALTPILAALAELDPTFDLAEIGIGAVDGAGDEPEGSPWPDEAHACPEDADSDEPDMQPDAGQMGDGIPFEMPTCDVFWLHDAA